MNSYEVCCYETVGGYVYVDAEDEDKAAEKAWEMLNQQGSECINDITSRDFDTCGVDKND